MPFISTKGIYGMAAMLELAVADGSAPLQIRNIAAQADLPQNYLEQLLTTLRKTGLVKSVRGSQGGYVLAKEAKDITLLEILTALEGDLYPTSVLVANPVLQQFWEDFYRNSLSRLNRTLAEIAESYRQQKSGLSYTI